VVLWNNKADDTATYRLACRLWVQREGGTIPAYCAFDESHRSRTLLPGHPWALEVDLGGIAWVSMGGDGRRLCGADEAYACLGEVSSFGTR
jgi:hypothetical protein